MILDRKTYADRLRACFLGKNIGGTLGTPLEGMQGVVDLTFYTHDVTQGVLPNDDLDLQLAFLCAAERHGVGVRGDILAAYWNAYIVPDWGEYGLGKRNLRAGLLPPLSGGYRNPYGESNGAWIRSELWACLAPGHPDIAVRYAYEDATVDHWGEGVWAEMFTAALESAAFATSDPEEAIDAALSFIPPECDIARVVAFVRACKADPSLDWKAARKKVLIAFPSSFGSRPLPGAERDPEIPLPGNHRDAPAGIGLMLLGHYYGGGDFSRALCIAAGCCDDADCTAGTLGAFYGILYGTAGIPEKWIAPIGDEIRTCSLDRTKAGIPDTVSELCARVARLMPAFCTPYLTENGDVQTAEGPALRAPGRVVGFPHSGGHILPFCTAFPADGLTLRAESAALLAFATASSLDVREGEVWRCTLRLDPKYIPFADRSARYTVTLHAPAEWEAPDGRVFSLECGQAYIEREAHTFSLLPRELRTDAFPVLVEVREVAGPGRLYFSFTLFHRI